MHFENNWARTGGGLAIEGDSPSNLDNVTFQSNEAREIRHRATSSDIIYEGLRAVLNVNGEQQNGNQFLYLPVLMK